MVVMFIEKSVQSQMFCIHFLLFNVQYHVDYIFYNMYVQLIQDYEHWYFQQIQKNKYNQ